MAVSRPRLRATGATKARLAVVAVAAAAVGVAVFAGPDSPPRPQAAIRVDFVYSPDLDERRLLAPLIARFNASGAEVSGRPVHVVGRPLTSGEAERRIAAGRLEPVLWTPASSLWSRLLNAHVRRTWASLESPSLVLSPQVIAIPEQRARRLGWPGRAIGWKDIPALVASGAVQFGHPSPLTSTSGLSALAAEFYAVTGKIAGLTIDDVHRARREVRKIEQSVVHYAPTAPDFLEQLAHYGPDHASAVVVQETTLVQFNEDYPWRIVAVYPADGTFMADYPLIVMDAGWVSRVEREAARAFVTWLRGEVTPEAAARSGYRLADEPVLPPVDPEHGADPREPDIELRAPAGDVLTAIQSVWKVDRKLADVVLAIDSSMLAKGKREELLRAVDRFLEPLTPRHRLGLIAFGAAVSTIVSVGPLGSNAETLRADLAGVTVSADGALYDAVAEGVRQAAATRDEARTLGLVVITDGADDASSLDLDRLRGRLRGSGVRVFTVAYGREADRKALETIATTSQGKAFTPRRGELGDVCHDIALFF